MLKYTATQLRQDFDRLQGFDDLTLTPLVETSFKAWKRGIPNRVITDFRRLPSQQSMTADESYVGIIGGKIVKLDASARDIDVEDEDEYWLMIGEVSFDGEEKPESRAFRNLQRFVKAQSIDALIAAAKAELIKGKTYHLSSGTGFLYDL